MAKTDTAKAAIHTQPQVSFGPQQAMENARDWDKDRYEAKNLEDGHHYDFSRKHLNFYVDRNGIRPLNTISHTVIMNRYLKRLVELQFVAYKGGATNQPNSYMDWVFSGNHDVMNRMAFGNQEVDFDYKHADNSHLRRMPEVESWAKDLYDFACTKFGEKNVFGVEVHLDETTVHAHVNVIPVALRQARGRAPTLYRSNDNPDVVLTPSEWKKLSSSRRKNYTKEIQERKSRECVSYSGLMGETAGDRSQYLRQFHTDYHLQVGCKYGLARGNYKEMISYDEQLERRHKTSVELETEKVQKLKELQERIDRKVVELRDRTLELGDVNEALAQKRKEMKKETGWMTRIGAAFGVGEEADLRKELAATKQEVEQAKNKEQEAVTKCATKQSQIESLQMENVKLKVQLGNSRGLSDEIQREKSKVRALSESLQRQSGLIKECRSLQMYIDACGQNDNYAGWRNAMSGMLDSIDDAVSIIKGFARGTCQGLIAFAERIIKGIFAQLTVHGINPDAAIKGQKIDAGRQLLNRAAAEERADVNVGRWRTAQREIDSLAISDYNRRAEIGMSR